MNPLPLDTIREIVRLRYVALTIALCQLHREIGDTEAALDRWASETGRVRSLKSRLERPTPIQGRQKPTASTRPEKRAGERGRPGTQVRSR